jgi:hypothetical protein
VAEASTTDGTLHVVPPTSTVPDHVYTAAAGAELSAYSEVYRCPPPNAVDIRWHAGDVGLRAAVEATWRAALTHLTESARAVASMRSSADLDARGTALAQEAGS